MMRRLTPQTRLLRALRATFPEGWWCRLDYAGIGGAGLPHIIGILHGHPVALWVRVKAPNPTQERIRLARERGERR